MYILIDSREKPRAISKITDYFQENGIKYETSKLFFGDYLDYSNPGIVIDRKQNVAELAQNCTSDHKRFKRELERVKATNSTLVLLIEQESFTQDGKTTELNAIEDLMLWEPQYGEIRGEKIYRVLLSWMNKYSLKVEFCSKKSTGKRIVEILGGGKND